MLELLQINVDRGRAAQELVFQTATKENVDLVLLSEPNKAMARRRNWYCDEEIDACIMKRNPDIKVTAWGKAKGFVWVKIKDVYIYSIYISPNVSDEAYEVFLQNIQDDMEDKGDKIIVGGDFNAKSPIWGSKVEDGRGKLLSEWLASKNLVVWNEGDKPTFQRGASASIIDVTISTEKLGRIDGRWRVLDEDSLSLHNYIRYRVAIDRISRKPVRWRRGVFSHSKFSAAARRNFDETGRTMDILAFMNGLKMSQGEAMEGVRQDADGRDVYWWTEEIQEIRDSVQSARRKLLRARASRRSTEEGIIILEADYKMKKKSLKKEISKSKDACWKKICRDTEEDIWGEGYRIVMRALNCNFPKIDLDEERRREIAEALFPEAEETSWQSDGEEEPQLTPFTQREMERAAGRLKIKRAPGPDGILPEVVKAIVNVKGGLVLNLVNDILMEGKFPDMWKRARLVLVPKPGKDLREANGFRPLCLLDTMGKLFEALILHRLEEELIRTVSLHGRQFGFRRGRSSVDAVHEVIGMVNRAGQSKWRALILLDVRNAFNTANWSLIVRELRRRGIKERLVSLITEYLKDRKLEISVEHVRDVNIGVPQGSILGPTLWNILYDGVLRIEKPEGTELVAYADDLALVVIDESEEGMLSKGNLMMQRIDQWMTEHFLALCPEKTEIVVFTLKKMRGEGFILRDTRIQPGARVKYLGVHIDRHLNFGAHIQEICNKAERVASALLRLMPNIGGPSSSKRKVLANVVNSTVQYAASVWHRGLAMRKWRERVTSVQRKAALRVSMAYRTVSTCAVLVVAGMIPLHLLVDERRRIYESEGNENLRVAARKRTFDIWQEEFDRDLRGRWTRRVI